MTLAFWPAAAQAHLAARKAIAPRRLLWLKIKTLAGAPFSVGFWTGDQDDTFVVEGESRTYYGAQGGLALPEARSKVGTGIRSSEAKLMVTPEAEAVLRGYNTRFGTAEVHTALYDPEGEVLLGIRRDLRVSIDGSPISTPAIDGGDASMGLRLVSSARRGTLTRNGKKSDQSQQERHPGDRFRRFGDLGDTASDAWGKR
ncbi:hypothetical protein [Pseudoroseicyclus aestuarii]|uniref:Uncharacterized protein n=1 Tax=Pseudoroseicyclus aestuarii TaxID=1795041 RepID=A0A318SSE8_9RHOB|nr:hypothetical protein [Pseudoroseicyclus aestuarii]PYE80810.1 hypothetical protein DFP88_11120 [Pseudoroseicyclus aestuarii]